MDYKKFLLDLKSKLKDSFEFSQEIAKNRDTRLIEGFINKGEEECSFNEFYSNGNENVVKYAGIIEGLKRKKYSFFENVPPDYSQKIQTMTKLAEKLMTQSDDYKETYNRFSLGAEFCLHDYIEEDMRYKKLDNKPLFFNLIESATIIVEAGIESSKNTMELQKLLEKGEKHIRQNVLIDKMLGSVKYTKRNAFYAVKNFDWLHEKGTFEHMSDLEVKVYYAKHITKEKRAKDELMNGKFSLESSSKDIGFSISS